VSLLQLTGITSMPDGAYFCGTDSSGTIQRIPFQFITSITPSFGSPTSNGPASSDGTSSAGMHDKISGEFGNGEPVETEARFSSGSSVLPDPAELAQERLAAAKAAAAVQCGAGAMEELAAAEAAASQTRSTRPQPTAAPSGNGSMPSGASAGLRPTAAPSGCGEALLPPDEFELPSRLDWSINPGTISRLLNIPTARHILTPVLFGIKSQIQTGPNGAYCEARYFNSASVGLRPGNLKSRLFAGMPKNESMSKLIPHCLQAAMGGYES
jgi:hypothetical protein